MPRLLRKLFGLCPNGDALHKWGIGEVITYNRRSMIENYTCRKCGKTKQIHYGSRI